VCVTLSWPRPQGSVDKVKKLEFELVDRQKRLTEITNNAREALMQ
jgi:hypothetical protein